MRKRVGVEDGGARGEAEAKVALLVELVLLQRARVVSRVRKAIQPEHNKAKTVIVVEGAEVVVARQKSHHKSKAEPITHCLTNLMIEILIILVTYTKLVRTDIRRVARAIHSDQTKRIWNSRRWTLLSCTHTESVLSVSLYNRNDLLKSKKQSII